MTAIQARRWYFPDRETRIKAIGVLVMGRGIIACFQQGISSSDIFYLIPFDKRLAFNGQVWAPLTTAAGICLIYRWSLGRWYISALCVFVACVYAVWFVAGFFLRDWPGIAFGGCVTVAAVSGHCFLSDPRTMRLFGSK
jgi:hypothetical protein